jgi:hypothetical protein
MQNRNEIRKLKRRKNRNKTMKNTLGLLRHSDQTDSYSSIEL